MHRLVRPLAAVALLAIAAGSVSALPPRRPLPDDALVAEGEKKLEAGDVDGALAAFQRAEALAPKDPRPRYLRGAALVKKDPEGAIAAYREALGLDATLAAVHAELGALLLDLGRLDDALGELKTSLKLDPALAASWVNIAKLEGRRNHTDASLAAWREAEKLLPTDVDVRIDHAMAMRKVGRHDDAIRAAREAVSLDGKSAPAQLALGYSLRSAGKLDDAAAAFTAAIKLSPQDASAHWALGVTERDRKHVAEAITSLRRAVELKPGPAFVEDLALALVADKKAAEGIEIATSAATSHPRSLAFRLVQVRVLVADQRCGPAEKVLAELPPAEPSVRAAAESLRKSCPAGRSAARAPARAGGKK